jgi:NTP pyrophosphatase (non-canonical NTP hydrolase)
MNAHAFVEAIVNDLENLRRKIREFRDARDWLQFHSPKNLAGSIAIEAAELMEIFQWCGSKESSEIAEQKKQAVADEVADIAIYLIEFAEIVGVDLGQAVLEKLDRNETRYPCEKVRGKSTKWSEL